MGILTALAVASGYAFAAIPNVKPISLVFFLAGACAGLSGGLLVSVLGMGIYSVANPWGPAPPVVIVAKIAGAALFGAAGALIGPRAARGRSALLVAVLLAAIAAALTLAYGVLVDLATAVAVGMGRHPIPTLVAGLPFNVAHIVSNVAIFALAGPPLLRRFARRATRLGAFVVVLAVGAAAIGAATPPAGADSTGVAVGPAGGADDSTYATIDSVEAANDSACAADDSAEAADDSTALDSSAPDSTGADSASAHVALAPRPPAAPPFDPYGALDTDAADATLTRAAGIARGSRTPLESFREMPHLAVERFGIVGSSERLLLLGEEGVGLRIAGVPILPSRSGLSPYDMLPTEALLAARVRRAAEDPLLGGRGPAGSLDWMISPSPAPDDPPLTSLRAERGPLSFRRYQAGFDRWVGPVRANVAYDAARDEDAFGTNLTRARGTFLSVATRANAAIPLFVAGGGTRRELDLSAASGSGGARGTEERSLAIVRAAPFLPRIGRARVALKADRVAWRATTDPGLRGREHESGASAALGEDAPFGIAAWGYAGEVVDEANGRERGTERVGGTALLAGERVGLGAASWRVFAGAERVSPVSPRVHAGATIARPVGRARLEFAAHRAYDHPPRGLLLDRDDLDPARHTGIAVSASLDSTLSLSLFRRSVSDGLFLRAADPFLAAPIRIDYDDWGLAIDGAISLAGATLSWGYLFLDDDAGSPLPLRPRHRGHAECERAWPFRDRAMRLALRAGCEIVGERAAFDRSTPLEATIDVRAAARLEIESVVLFLQAENLLDRFNPALPGVYPEARGFYLGATWLLKD